ncbi:DNA translocase FtsK [Methyloversatilis discipulorum]|uniref:DNA translocase FtsK n=1 Tax=Methyloversatilis discipulorum TaxID=1119528 RepID=UPI001A4A4DDD|nr:DNA translocase FtsK [Methyloversatilis discipulorum]MBL8468397.1 DNA translocase FtsK 4TM domain-containing protein [Methyloversatilis discipulorum]
MLHEARWLVLAAIALYLVMVLGGYDRADPGWSHASVVEQLHNPGGRFGAWLSDLALFLFGLSAWWWVIMLIGGCVWLSRSADRREDRRPLFVALGGFLLVLLASCALEAIRFHSMGAELPVGPGGMVGIELGRLIAGAFGFTGGTLLLLVTLGVGLSAMTGVTWLRAAETVGRALELAWFASVSAWARWRDRRIGEQVAEQREAVVEAERRKPTRRREPVRIEVPEVEVQKSERVEKERQQTLFADLPGSLPPLALLDEAKADIDPPSPESLELISRQIERKLADFNVEVKVLAAYPGPVITRYEIEPATGVKGSQIVNLVKDLARALSVMSIRVVETIPGKSCMGLEIPNTRRQIVRLSEILGSAVYHDMASPLTMALGKDIGGQPMVADLARMPHVLVAGTTGSGKSVAINAMILSLLYKADPSKVRLIMVDPKMLELSVYEGIPHLLAPVVTDMRHAANALNWCVGEMDRRYKLMSAMGVRNLAGYNSKITDAEKAGTPLTNPFSITPETPEPLSTMPMIVVVIDELADLMMVAGKKIEELIARLAQKARAAGIHLILATQRPSVDVITGLIKANVPTRIAFQVSSKIDSRTILDQMGAEALLGQGDMLYLAPGTGVPTRVHGAFVADGEVHKVVEHLKTTGAPDYVEGILSGAGDDEGGELSLDGASGGSADGESDPLYDQAVEVVLKTRRPSISLVQRHLRIGYNRAARLIEQMERSGLVSPMNATGGREVLAPAREE